MRWSNPFLFFRGGQRGLVMSLRKDETKSFTQTFFFGPFGPNGVASIIPPGLCTRIEIENKDCRNVSFVNKSSLAMGLYRDANNVKD